MVVLASLCVISASARAQDDDAANASLDKEARSLFEAGETAYADGRFEAALDYFQRAYELSDRPQLLYNVAQAADRLRRDDEALEALRTYRDRLPNAPNRAAVDSRIRTLEERQHEAAAPPPQAVPVEPPAPEPLAEPTPAPEPSPLDQDLQAAAASDAAPASDDGGEGGVLSKWWFWAGAGAVVAAAVVVAVVAGSSDGPEERVGGTDGAIVITLSRQ